MTATSILFGKAPHGITESEAAFLAALIALDPDIPPAQQRILFAGEALGAHSRWVFNWKEIGMAGGPLLWEPQLGQHTLALVDEVRRVLDAVPFVVRGTERPPLP